MPAPFIARPVFVPLAIVTLALGNACDLIGTYINQPGFERELNPLYHGLRLLGVPIGWPAVIIAKVMLTIILGWGLTMFMARRRGRYPQRGLGLREFFTTFVYGRPLTWIQAIYSLPRDWRHFALCVAAALGVAGPVFAFLGYDNIARHCAWPTLPWIHVGRIWFPTWLLLLLVPVLWLGWQVWRDYRAATAA